MKRIVNKTRLLISFAAAVLSLSATHSVYSLDLAQSPLFLAKPVKPLVMLNMSNDHQLYFKAYDDYTDLDDDNVPDTTYMDDYDYYGYFDSGKCYSYSESADRFVPKALAAGDNKHYCDTVDGDWSGNFLNWATMTRMDAVRKILYGGYRSTDGNKDGITVLERAFLPQDAHAFAKYYNGDDIGKLTEHDYPGGTGIGSGITLCNATDSAYYDNSHVVLSQSNNRPPKIMVAKGNYSLWASNERWQCRWGQGSNGNDFEDTGIPAYSSAPKKEDGDEYVARVEVCKNTELEEDNCVGYPDGNLKPAGLLQKYGEKGQILFGLMTGSYGSNKSGGVLRKNVSDLSDEIAVDTDGRFVDSNSSGIVKTLDSLRIHGYLYSGTWDNGRYNDNNADKCPWALNEFKDGECSNWGNPQSEIYLESLRYLAGLSANPNYAAADSSYIDGLPSPGWDDPIGEKNYCAPLNIIQFNASSSSYDDGAASDASGLNEIGSLDEWTNKVGSAESIHGKSFFVGQVSANDDQLCTAKTVGSLSSVAGTCPDAPRLGGTYGIAGLAYYARNKPVRSDYSVETVKTFGVALAPAVPQVSIPVSDGKAVKILPACRNNLVGGNCAIVDFKIIEQSSSGKSGTLYVNWEDSEQGGDFDQDMWGLIKYDASLGGVKVTTQVMAQSTGDAMGFGYVISGTTRDGFHAHSGINGFSYKPANSLDKACTKNSNGGGSNCNCRIGNGYGGTAGSCNYTHSDAKATFENYVVGESSASLLEPPLYYAAKWGGYSDDENGVSPDIEDIREADPETYYYAIEPAELEENLSAALDKIQAEQGSASSVAANSTRLGTDTVVYQAVFDSANWSGSLKALKLEKITVGEGEEKREIAVIGGEKWATDNSKFDSPTARDIYTFSNGSGVEFSWENLSDAQKLALMGGNSADTDVGKAVLNWVRGADEPGLRERSLILGDIVNSSPVFAGRKDYRFDRLAQDLDLGADKYRAYFERKEKRREVVYVSANDGMLHAFDAGTGEELFAYVPSGVYSKLKDLASPGYGGTNNPHKYNVDGPLFVGDAYVNGEWKNILVGTLGAGGRGVFALDVTEPGNFGEDKVLFELTGDDFPDLGNVLNQPVIAPTADGWKLFFGNGYDAQVEKASLFIVDLANPLTDTQVVTVSDAGPNGLAGAALLTDGTGGVSSAYAGDLFGNMWKFDIIDKGSDKGKWQVALGGSPLFTAKYPAVDEESEDQVQPITATPTLGLNRKMDNSIMVYFGTGSYLTSSDNSSIDINSVYAIADQDEVVSGRDSLMQKTISESGGIRDVAKNDDTSWWTGKKGWYMDFSTTPGERVTSKPLLEYDRLLFPTLIPSADPCAFGGSGWEMELIAVGDQNNSHSIFGEDGKEVKYAVIGYSGVMRDGDNIINNTNNIKGENNPKNGGAPPGAIGRMSWRQLR